MIVHHFLVICRFISQHLAWQAVCLDQLFNLYLMLSACFLSVSESFNMAVDLFGMLYNGLYHMFPAYFLSVSESFNMAVDLFGMLYNGLYHMFPAYFLSVSESFNMADDLFGMLYNSLDVHKQLLTAVSCDMMDSVHQLLKNKNLDLNHPLMVCYNLALLNYRIQDLNVSYLLKSTVL